jgi:hypothetical protein
MFPEPWALQLPLFTEFDDFDDESSTQAKIPQATAAIVAIPATPTHQLCCRNADTFLRLLDPEGDDRDIWLSSLYVGEYAMRSSLKWGFSERIMRSALPVTHEINAESGRSGQIGLFAGSRRRPGERIATRFRRAATRPCAVPELIVVLSPGLSHDR